MLKCQVQRVAPATVDPSQSYLGSGRMCIQYLKYDISGFAMFDGKVQRKILAHSGLRRLIRMGLEDRKHDIVICN